MCDVCHRWNARCRSLENNNAIDELLNINIQNIIQGERTRKRRYGDMDKLHGNEMQGDI